MAAIYSTKLAAGSVNAGSNVNVLTVPAGQVAVIRSITCADVLAVAGLIIATVGGIWIASFQGSAVQYLAYYWEGRHVLEGGDVLNFDAITSDWTYYVSGYLLVS